MHRNINNFISYFVAQKSKILISRRAKARITTAYNFFIGNYCREIFKYVQKHTANKDEDVMDTFSIVHTGRFVMQLCTFIMTDAHVSSRFTIFYVSNIEKMTCKHSQKVERKINRRVESICGCWQKEEKKCPRSRLVNDCGKSAGFVSYCSWIVSHGLRSPSPIFCDAFGS